MLSRRSRGHSLLEEPLDVSLDHDELRPRQPSAEDFRDSLPQPVEPPAMFSPRSAGPTSPRSRSSSTRSSRSSSVESGEPETRARAFSLGVKDEHWAHYPVVDLLGRSVERLQAKQAAQEAIARIKRAYKHEGQRLQLTPDESGEHLFVVRSQEQVIGYIRRDREDFLFLDADGNKIHREDFDVIVAGFPEFRSSTPNETVARKIRDAYCGKSVARVGGSVVLTPDATLRGYSFRVELDHALLGYAKTVKGYVHFVDLKHKLLLEIPQNKIPSLLFGGDIVLREIRHLYHCGGASVRMERFVNNPYYTHAIRSAEQNVGFANETPDTFTFFSKEGEILMEVKKCEMLKK